MSEKKNIIRPDYDYWIKMPHWTLYQAVYLIHGERPKNDCIPNSRRDLHKTHELIKKSLFFDSYNSPSSDLRVTPSEFIQWAIENGITIPDELRILGKSNEMVTKFYSAVGVSSLKKNFEKMIIYLNDFNKSEAKKEKSELSNQLIFCAEYDDEIIIQERGKRKKHKFKYDYINFGYRNSSSKEWSDLIQILQNPKRRYHLGKSKDKSYDRRRRRLFRINKKLISLIKNNFPNVKIPDDEKLFERCKGKKPGIYKFKFMTVSRHSESESFDQRRKKYEKQSKEILLSTLADMSREYARNPKANYLKKDNEAITTDLMERHGLTTDEIRDFILGKTTEEFINEEFSNIQEKYEEDINRDIIDSNKPDVRLNNKIS